MARPLLPAYRTRPSDPQAAAEATSLALERYRLVLARQQQRQVVALLMAHPTRQQLPRPRWLELAIDYLATPAVWTVAILEAWAIGPWIVPVGLALVAALVWWTARPGAG